MANTKPQSSREEILSSVGDISGVDIFHAQVLIGVYIKPERTSGGIILTDSTRDEDKWQGKAGLVLKVGPGAFVDDGSNSFHGRSVKAGDWVLFKVSDGFSLDLNGTRCRLMDDVHVRGVISDPKMVF